ncbi:MAG TPA: major facilitator superfamily domain-containing protein 6 [Promineifilum sp.]|nr:major facilitator superfamily domain-containing protein 6 [Promineifilum sp.]
MSYLRPKTVYFFYYAALACLYPFMTLYYQERGMTATQIGILSGVVPLVTWLSAPLWGGLADARNRHRAVLLLAVGGLWIAAAAMSFATTFIALLATVIAYAVFNGPIVPMVDNAVMALLGERKADYSRVRVWGGYSWGLAALALAPMLERAGLQWAFYGFLFFMAINFVASARLPMNVVEGARHAYTAGLGILLRNGRFLLLLLVALVFGISMGGQFSYMFLYVDELGGSRALMALSVTASTVGEIPFWYLGGWLLRRVGTKWMIVLALSVTAVRNFWLGVMGAPWLVLPITALEGLSFAVLFSAGVSDVDAAAPSGLGATAQGLFSGMMLGLGSALGGFIGGPIGAAAGYAQFFTLLGWLSLATLIVFVMARRGR